MKKHLISSVVVSMLCLGVPQSYAYEKLNLPQMGEPADLVMSPKDEKIIGRGYMRKIRQYLDLVTGDVAVLEEKGPRMVLHAVGIRPRARPVRRDADGLRQSRAPVGLER